jgi:hypothetical protein
VIAQLQRQAASRPPALRSQRMILAGEERSVLDFDFHT